MLYFKISASLLFNEKFIYILRPLGESNEGGGQEAHDGQNKDTSLRNEGNVGFDVGMATGMDRFTRGLVPPWL